MRTIDDIQRQIQELDMLLDPIANAEVDINDPNWPDNLRQAPHPLDEAGIREPAEQATRAMLELFLTSNSKGRGRIRKLLADHANFAWAMAAPVSADPEIAFRDRVLLCVIDDAADTRDAMARIGAVVDEAQSNNINYRPILRRIAKVAGTADRHGFGSMRSVLMRHC